jgi:hypothetical protein
MAISATNISVFNVATELNQSTTDVTFAGQIFTSSVVQNSADAGNYHNFNNMTPSNSASFVTAILTPYNAGSDMALANWAYYNHNIQWEVTFELINNGSKDVAVDLYFGANNSSLTDLFYSTNLASGTTDTQTNYLTGLASYNTGYSGYGGSYFILMNAVPADPTNPQYMDVTNAIDTDGAGPDTTRTSFTSVNGTWDFFNNGNFSAFVVAGGTQNVGISWSKRTTFQITFY